MSEIRRERVREGEEDGERERELVGWYSVTNKMQSLSRMPFSLCFNQGSLFKV